MILSPSIMLFDYANPFEMAKDPKVKHQVHQWDEVRLLRVTRGYLPLDTRLTELEVNNP